MRFEFAYMRLSFFPYSFETETYTPVVPLADSSLKTHKNHTLWDDTYLYGLYKGVPPPPTPPGISQYQFTVPINSLNIKICSYCLKGSLSIRISNQKLKSWQFILHFKMETRLELTLFWYNPSFFFTYGKSCSSYAIQYCCFIVLLSFLTLIQVQYIHKIQRKMWQGSPRKRITLVERTTFKNMLINK